MADLAAVFHWPPSELYELELTGPDGLLAWHAQAKRALGR